MTDYLVGTSGWHYEHWKGLFYPEDLPGKSWLGHYGQYFSTVASNNTFYRMPSESAVASWSVLPLSRQRQPVLQQLQRR